MEDTCYKIPVKHVGDDDIIDIHDLYTFMCADSKLLQTTVYEVFSNCLSDGKYLPITRNICIDKIHDIMEDTEVHEVFRKLLSYIDINILPSKFQILIWR